MFLGIICFCDYYMRFIRADYFVLINPLLDAINVHHLNKTKKKYAIKRRKQPNKNNTRPIYAANSTTRMV